MEGFEIIRPKAISSTSAQCTYIITSDGLYSMPDEDTYRAMCLILPTCIGLQMEYVIVSDDELKALIQYHKAIGDFHAVKPISAIKEV